MRTQAPAAARPSNPAPRAASSPLIASRRAAESRTDGKEEFILIPTRTPRKPKTSTESFALPNWALLGGGLLALLIYLWFVLPHSAMFTFILVIAGWVLSVTLHEFAHALVAYIGGDHTVKDKGYLSLNPQVADLDLLPRKYRWVVQGSTALRRLSEYFPPMLYLADSLYVTSTRDTAEKRPAPFASPTCSSRSSEPAPT